jgi:GntR family transcriptional regulator, galactonate operon transcriptional repressor
MLCKVELKAHKYYADREWGYPLMLRNHRYPRRGIHGETVHEIGRQIVSGKVKPGDMLPEAKLIAELGVSRTVLREAIKVLGTKGLVEARPRTGTKVSARNHWRLMDPDILAWQSETGLNEPFLRNLAEVRYVIEPAVTKLAAQRATQEEIDVIEQAYRQMEAHVVHSEAFVAADMQFHFGILAACHNEMLEQMSSAIGEALEISRKVTIELPGSSEASLPLHKAVLAAIRKRDADAAENAMERLIEFVQNDIKRFLRQHDTGVEQEARGTSAAGDASLRLIRGAAAKQETNGP